MKTDADTSVSQVHHRPSGKLVQNENTEYLPKHNLEKHYFKLEIHSFSSSSSLPKCATSSSQIRWCCPCITFRCFWFLKGRRCNDKQFRDKLKNSSNQGKYYLLFLLKKPYLSGFATGCNFSKQLLHIFTLFHYAEKVLKVNDISASWGSIPGKSQHMDSTAFFSSKAAWSTSKLERYSRSSYYQQKQPCNNCSMTNSNK